MRKVHIVVSAVVSALCALPAMALSNRVFVSPVGTDAGACPITSPCRTFAYGLTQVNLGGEIIAMDTAGYGPMVINKAVTVVAAPGATAFIAVTGGGTGILVNAPSTDTVNLRGLALSGNEGDYGIQFTSGKSVNVEHCVINGFKSSGIYMWHNGDLMLQHMNISHSTIRNNNHGISVAINPFPAAAPPSASIVIPPQQIPTAGVTITDCEINDNGRGISGGNASRVAVSDSTISGNGIGIFTAAEDGVPAIASVDRCEITQNGIGISAGATSAQAVNGLVRVANTKISFNTTGVTTTTDGQIWSRVTAGTSVLLNTLEDNYTNGAFTNTYVAK